MNKKQTVIGHNIITTYKEQTVAKCILTEPVFHLLDQRESPGLRSSRVLMSFAKAALAAHLPVGGLPQFDHLR